MSKVGSVGKASFTAKSDGDISRPWAVSIDASQAPALGSLRLIAGIEVCTVESRIWLSIERCDKTLERRLRALPGAQHFIVLPDRQLLPIDSRLLCGWLPQGPWVPLPRWLGVDCPPSCMPAQTRPAIALELRPSDHYCEPSALLTSLEAWATCASDAPQVRLDRWRFAVADDRRVLVVGQPLPSLPGERYVDRQGIFVAAGRHWHPAVDAEVVRQLFQLEKNDFVLWHSSGAAEKIVAGDFVRATRAAIRASAAGQNYST